MTKTPVLPLLIAVALAAGCSSTTFVRIAHPLQVGHVEPNAIPREAVQAARARGLPPGALVDEARLTELTPERICIDLSLWSVETHPQRSSVQSYRVALLNDEDGVENTSAQVELGQPETTPMDGFVVEREATGTRRVCAQYRNNQCIRFREETVYENVRYPHTWEVTTEPSRICFANGGFITPSSARVAIELTPRDAGGATRFAFEWSFESAVAETQPQTSGGDDS